MRWNRPTLDIGIPVYAGVDLLDLAAPAEVFSVMKEKVKDRCAVAVHVMGRTRAPVRTHAGLPIVPTATFDDAPGLDLLWVPGADVAPLHGMMQDEPFLDHLRRWAGGAEYVTSVCNGAMLLAAAGLLNGYRATTHWAFIPCLRQYPEVHVVEKGPDDRWLRFVVDPETPGGSGTRVTGGGISSGLDESLQIVQMLFGEEVAEEVQLYIQYFPDPPVHAELQDATRCPLPARA